MADGEMSESETFEQWWNSIGLRMYTDGSHPKFVAEQAWIDSTVPPPQIDDLSYIGVRCADCRLPYDQCGVDCSLTEEQWAMIQPRADDGGVLCALCIARRAHELPHIDHAELRLLFTGDRSWASPIDDATVERITKAAMDLTGWTWPEIFQEELRQAIRAAIEEGR